MPRQSSPAPKRMTGTLALNARQSRFVEAYVKHPNEPHLAAVEAGVPEDRAKRTANMWLHTPHIVAAIGVEAQRILDLNSAPAAQALADLLHSKSAYARLEASKEILNRSLQQGGQSSSVRVNITIGADTQTQAPQVKEVTPIIDGDIGDK